MIEKGMSKMMNMPKTSTLQVVPFNCNYMTEHGFNQTFPLIVSLRIREQAVTCVCTRSIDQSQIQNTEKVVVG